MKERDDGKLDYKESCRAVLAQNYIRIIQRVRSNLWTWQGYDYAYRVDDAIGDAVEILLLKVPEHGWTENEVVRVLTKYAANKLNKNYRREQRKAPMENDVAQEEAFPKNSHENPELKHDINVVLDELCKKTGKFSLQVPYIILRDLWGDTPKEIARAWHTTEQAVRQTLWRADKNIDEILKKDENHIPSSD
jgi:DNA-directed RNA polymerase specialized sigma24 family protein